MEQSFTHRLLSPGTSGSLPVPAGTIGTIAHSIMSEVFYHCATPTSQHREQFQAQGIK
jgi:hypothetical protein